MNRNRHMSKTIGFYNNARILDPSPSHPSRWRVINGRRKTMAMVLNLLSFVDRVVGGGDAPRHVVDDRSEIYRCFQLYP